MFLSEFNGKRVLKSSLLGSDDLEAFFTTRDLSLKYGEREDLKSWVEENKNFVCKSLNIEKKNLIIPVQTHSDNVKIIKTVDENVENTDALVTKEKNIALGLNFADCVPIIFYDPVEKIIANAHAGWRGTVQKIGVKTVEKMIELGSKPENIFALIGPAIGKCCFEAKPDVLQKLASTIDNPHIVISENHADLKQINKLQLLACGLKNIDVCEYCTSCSVELFFSYRKEKGNTARHSAIIMMKGD